MFPVNDALDAIFLGCFFFGVLLTLAMLVLGFADIGHDAGSDHGELGLLNVSTILAFVGWFGGVGYLARNGLGAVAILSVVLALVGGLAGGAMIWWVLRKVRSGERFLDPKDYELPGTIARVTSSIRAGGVGEVIYELQDVRRVAAARSVDGRAIPRGTEVVILHTTGGMAMVQPFDDLLEEHEREREPDRLAAT